MDGPVGLVLVDKAIFSVDRVLYDVRVLAGELAGASN
jgi:hypothetical protein